MDVKTKHGKIKKKKCSQIVLTNQKNVSTIKANIFLVYF